METFQSVIFNSHDEQFRCPQGAIALGNSVTLRIFVSKALSALVELNYVELENDENKKYRSKYHLTKSGKKVKDALDNKIADVVADDHHINRAIQHLQGV